MKRLTCILFVFALATPARAEAPERISVQPDKVLLDGIDDGSQLVVTGHFAGDKQQDLTARATFRGADARVATVDERGLVTPVSDGQTQIIIEAAGKSFPLSVKVSGTKGDRPVNFVNEVIPVLTKLGCNTGGCHGKADGQNGFKLSLLGFDPKLDYNALVREGRGRRVMPSAPALSLLLVKPVGAIGHGGGKLLQPDSAEYRLLLRWIAGGTPYGKPDDPRIVRLSVFPEKRTLELKGSQQLAVTAHFSDGSARDVTPRAEFRTNDEEMIVVDERGQVQALERTGAGSIMIRYQGLVTLFRATMPQELPADKLVLPAARNFIDEHVFKRLRELGVPASELCSDGEFLRRASLDITGTLPTAEEAARFIADPDPKKRDKLIDTLLSKPEYAAYFTLKWGDILRLKGGGRDNKPRGGKDAHLDTPADRADAFQAWIRQSLADNMPYDQFVRAVITTDGHTSGKEARPQILWYLELKTPEQLVDDTAQAFLGTRIQCARCHHHPFEKWSQEDYWGLAGFYGRVQWLAPNKEGKFGPTRESPRLGQMVSYNAEGKLTDPQGRVFDKPCVLDGPPLDIAAKDDPRHQLVDWMARPDNPYFARTLVNRYWGHFFARGIVEPLDDLRVTNPPTNPELLDALARDFVAHKFDLKHVIRTICTSATYQLSCQSNEHNRQDVRNHAWFVPRRMSAEVLLDAIDKVTDSPTEFTAMGGKKFPAGTRAIDLPDVFVSSYFLSVFGKPKRDSACECERETSTTLAQRAHLLNSAQIRQKLSARAAKLKADERPDLDKIKEVYLGFFAREPNAAEVALVQKYLANKKDARDPSEGWGDVLWALLNSKEFSFNH
ncbi:MAG: DUF1553 domain-containing protein [Gemmataceae bacterium]